MNADHRGNFGLTTAVPRLELYAQSFGLPIRHTGAGGLLPQRRG